jgi:hypothetical protein
MPIDRPPVKVQLFESTHIRSAWDEVEEKWWFSALDIVAALTDQPDYAKVRNYWKWLKNKLKQEGSEVVSVTNQLKLEAPDGKQRLTDVLDTQQVFRIIQSIPSRKAEPFKLWLAEVANQRLDQLQTIAAVPEGFIHDVWMHCSYAIRDDKHAVKAPLNRLIRRRMLESGLSDLDTEYVPPEAQPPAKKPTLAVIAEWFHNTHSVYRVLYPTVLALKQNYRLIGYGLDMATDEETRSVFDEFVLIDGRAHFLAQVNQVVSSLKEARPQIIYYLGIGMFP